MASTEPAERVELPGAPGAVAVERRAGALARRRRTARLAAVPVAALAAVGTLVAVRAGRPSTGAAVAPPPVAVVDVPVDDNRTEAPGSWREVRDPWMGDGPGPLAITAARAEPGDGRTLRAWFWGNRGDTNSVDLPLCVSGYRLVVHEDTDAVTLTLVRYERFRSPGEVAAGCLMTLIPEPRSLRVHLDAPLGGRTVIDRRAKAPVPAVAQVTPTMVDLPPIVVSVPGTSPPSAQPPLTTFPSPTTATSG